MTTIIKTTMTMTMKNPNIIAVRNHQIFSCLRTPSCSWTSSSSDILDSAQRLVHDFDPKIPIEKAVTPPSSWYTDPSFLALELDRVFYRGWQAVGLFWNPPFHSTTDCNSMEWETLIALLSGYTEQIKDPRDFFTGRYNQSICLLLCPYAEKFKILFLLLWECLQLTRICLVFG